MEIHSEENDIARIAPSIYECKKSETVHAGRFTILSDLLSRNGREAIYDYIEIRSGISVIPFLTSDTVLLQREYRYPIRQWQYETVSGIIDPGETPEQAARREIKEETGYEADRLISLGSFYPSFGATNEEIFLFAAHLSQKGDTDTEPLEAIEHITVTIDRFKDMIADGSFAHGAGLAAWARYTARQDLGM